VQWCEEVQLPKLAKDAHYQRQFQDRISELNLKLANLEKDIAGGRLDLEPAAGQVRRELCWLESLVEVPHG